MASDAQDPTHKSGLARVVWSLMASEAKATGGSGEACNPIKNKCTVAARDVCLGWLRGTSDPLLQGKCTEATGRYIRVQSPRVQCTDCANPAKVRWNLAEPDAEATAVETAGAWPADPIWAESSWPPSAPRVEIFVRESPAAEAGVLASGLLGTAAVAAATVWVQRAFQKRMGLL